MQDETFALKILNDAFGSILDLRGLAIRSILPSDRDRPLLDTPGSDLWH